MAQTHELRVEVPDHLIHLSDDFFSAVVQPGMDVTLTYITAQLCRTLLPQQL